jgi:hypothetical protein
MERGRKARRASGGDKKDSTGARSIPTMGNLASTYWNQGRWTEGEKLEVQVMERFKKVLDPNTLTNMWNLSRTSAGSSRAEIMMLWLCWKFAFNFKINN